MEMVKIEWFLQCDGLYLLKGESVLWISLTALNLVVKFFEHRRLRICHVNRETVEGYKLCQHGPLF